MRFLTITSLLLSLVAPAAYAEPVQVLSQKFNDEAGLFEIQKVVIERVAVEDLKTLGYPAFDYDNDCSRTSTSRSSRTFADQAGPITTLPTPTPTPIEQPPTRPTPPMDLPGRGGSNLPPSIPSAGELIGLDEIMNIGQKVWQFLVDNKPVVKANVITANALPRGVRCWDDLENWSRPRSEVYKATYYNGFGMEVVNLEFRLVYTHGGQVNGLGRYLTNVTMQYRKLDVMWGFNVNADVEIPLVVNVAEKGNPVAGMQIALHWTIRGLNHLERTASFFVYGDGRPTDVLE